MWDFISRLDLTQLFTTLFIALVSGYLAGKIGVHRALEQARKERAFDRALEWHESTLRAVNKFRFLSRRYLDTLLERRTFLPPENSLPTLAKQLEECTSDLQKALFEAVLFAEKKTVSQLRLAADVFEEIIPLAGKVASQHGMFVEGEFDLLKQLTDLDKIAVAIHVALVEGIRNQLGLDKLTSSDLGLGPEPKRSELIRGFIFAWFPWAAKLFPRMFPELRESKNKETKEEVTKA